MFPRTPMEYSLNTGIHIVEAILHGKDSLSKPLSNINDAVQMAAVGKDNAVSLVANAIYQSAYESLYSQQ